MASEYSSYHEMQDDVIRNAPPYPGERFSGRGIVICAGGARYFTCAWVLLRVLREVVRCKLPVEIWYLGAREMDERMAKLLRSQGAATVDACAITGSPKEGWPLKPFSILHSRFREVILIDADNIPVQDPEKLFETRQYFDFGALFWPDGERLEPHSKIWEICRLPFVDEPAFESGQVVIDKARCWKALLLTMHLNEQSDFYYRYIYGDKDTFHLAWRMLGQPYGMTEHRTRIIPPYRQAPSPEYWSSVMGQNDLDGNLLFQHRNFPKWILFGFNPSYPRLRYERECLAFLSELASLWDGRVPPVKLHYPERVTPGARLFRCVRLSYDERLLEFLPNGRIGKGNNRAERAWRFVSERGRQRLEIWGDGFLACTLDLHSDGVWRGQWNYFERMPLELTELT